MKGFTLIELIVVIVILGVLSAIALPTIASGTTEKYQAVYNGGNQCTYILQADTSKMIDYNSNTGIVVTNN